MVRSAVKPPARWPSSPKVLLRPREPQIDSIAAIGFFAKERANAADFVVNRFERGVGSHHARDIVLQRRAEHAAEHRNDEQPHQDARERAAEMKSSVKKNHW